MIRAMTALCAVATAFACFPQAALARAAHRDAKVQSFEPAAPHGHAAPSHTPKHAGPALSVRTTREKPDDKPASRRAPVAEGRVETHASKASKDDDDALMEFEEPSGAPGVAARSHSVVKLAEPAHDAAPGKHGKKKHRLIRPLPPNASWKPYRREPWRRGYVSVAGHGKSWSGYLVGADGEVITSARRALSAALCSWRTGKEMLLDEKLMGLIADVSDEFGGRPIRVVSGYREHSYAPGSKHKSGQAFDFSVPGVPNDALRDFLRTLGDVGVGYYPNSTHVHLDVREQPTYWVDYSAPGGHPMYAYDRRVARMSPHERDIAAALDVLATHHEPLGRPATEAVQRRAPLMAAADPARAKSSVPLSRAAFAPVEPVFLTHEALPVPDAGTLHAASTESDVGANHDAGRPALPDGDAGRGRDAGAHDAGPATR
jgi:hypothetical protein